ncbi:M16 family metallopeptidase [Budvicia diplopodorum]|uniref:M16 family metallopeptidase n=1 Tax=Budvicia diplopodorum TaxID=1119056 RepID=UPI001357056F|nr:pitrilysin family protein [Budvicia diplopodorum]
MKGKYLLSALGGMMFMMMGIGVQAEPLRPDPAWQEGKLENGFKWKILTTPHRPTDKLEIRLEINAGSLQESIPQVGFSYLIPQSAVVKTVNFGPAQVKDLLAQIVPETAPKSLVEVSYDYTRYNLSLPNNKPELLKEAFSWLSDAIANPQLDAQQIEASRTATASIYVTVPANVNDAWWRYRIKNSPLIGHDPGQPVSAEASVEQLKEFYQKWYTPDVMTLYAVGNVDRRALVEQINKAFGGIQGKRASPATIAVLTELPDTPVNLISTAVDKDRLTLIWDDPWHPVVDTASLERVWIADIANEMIKDRLQKKISHSALKGSLLDVTCQMQFQRNECHMTLDAPLQMLKPSMKFVTTELVKLNTDGVTGEELAALVAVKKQALAAAIATYAKTDTAEIMAQYWLVQKSGSVAVSPEQYQQLRQKFLGDLDLANVNIKIHQLLTIKPTLVLTQPSGEQEENVQVLSELFDSIMTPKAQEKAVVH